MSAESYPDWFSEAFRALDLTANEVAIKIGYPNVKLYNITSGKTKPGYETIQQILTAYPRLNANWLLKGQKPILHTSGAEIISSVTYDSVNLPLYLAPNPYTTNMTSNETFPVLTRNTDVNTLTDSVVIRLIDNSMSPRLVSGTLLLARPVKLEDWDYLNSKVVAVLYRSTFVVRRIKENELLTRNYLTLYADSAESGFVPVKREDLRSIWQILEIIGGGIE